MKIGTTDISKIYIGSTNVDKIYIGSTQVYSGGSTPTGTVLSYSASSVVTPYNNNFFDASGNRLTIVSNTVSGGRGQITFNGVLANIGERAFNQCTGMYGITIPNTVTSIGNYAFLGCSGFYSITIPDSVTSLGDGVLMNAGISEITLGSGITSIPYDAFYNCTSLSSITIPNSVTSIGGEAFLSCSNLHSITIPTSVTSISYNAFRESGLYSIDIPTSITSIESSTFYASSLTSVTIPTSVTSIGYDAFSQCNGLSSVTIPSSIISIDVAFQYCTNLSSVTCEATTPPQLGYGAFDGNASDRKIYVPSASVSDYKEATNWSDYANYIQAIIVPVPFDEIWYTSTDENVVTPSYSDRFYDADGNVLNILSNTYNEGKGIIKLSGNLATISNAPFYYSTTLSSIIMPDSLTEIGNSAFNHCTSLSSITIPNSVTIIGELAFECCDNVSSITIGSGITYIGQQAFASDNYQHTFPVMYIYAVTPPSLGYLAFYKNTPTGIYVPSASVSDYQNATNWSEYASVIQAMP